MNRRSVQVLADAFFTNNKNGNIKGPFFVEMVR